jgi:hypothetical protein
MKSTNFIQSFSFMNNSWKAVWFVLLATSRVCTSFSQIIYIDKTDTSAYVRKALLNGTISLGMEVDKQKQTLFDASNFLDLSLQKFREFYILSASNRFTYNGSSDFLNTGYAHFRWRHNYKNKWHPETYLQYQWDDKLGMKSRFVAGENIRHTLLQNQLSSLSIASGLMYENETWDYIAVDSSKTPVNHPDVHASHVKSNSYVKYDIRVSSASNFSIIVFYQALVNHFFQPRIAANLDFNAAISKHFLLDIKFSDLYDAAPVVPIIHFYYTLAYSLMYKF